MFTQLKKVLGYAEMQPSDSPVQTIVVEKKRYSSEIEEIHHEFETAADKLVEEANNIIKKENEKSVKKAKLLEELGFKISRELVGVKQMAEKIKLSREQLSLISYYRNKYPLNKFITEEQVKEICNKYGLVFGNVSLYKGFVPEKNLLEIKSFKVDKKDIKTFEFNEAYVIMDDWSLLNLKDIEKAGYQWLGSSTLEKKMRYLKENPFGHSFIGSRSYHPDSTVPKWGKSFILTEDLLKNFQDIDTDIKKALKRNDISSLKMPSLKICAPLKDMDTTNMLIDDYKFVNKYKDIPDPVVLQPVKGGYLILTAWGDEASDPIVVNEINN